MQLTPYLMFNGQCEEALNFYAKALDGEIKSLMHFEGSPAENMSVDKKQVMHSHFEAKGILFMASDSGQPGTESTQAGGVHLSINFDTAEEEEKVFNALAEGGKVTMPLQDTFWGARFGMLTDKYGINWMFNHDKPQQQ
jgi:PhnB protein